MSQPGTPPGGHSRDRDQAGRPRNARPRDELGRPLPRAAAQPASQTLTSPSVAITPGEAADLGGSLLLAGRPFHAHEVFEDAWKSADGPERDLWRGLAQVAVGLTHARRGNARGASALLTRGASRLRDYAGRALNAGDADSSGQAAGPYGIDVAFVESRADALAARIEREGLASLPADALLLSMCATPPL